VSHENPQQLTAEQKAQLEAELAEFEGPKRAEMVEAIRVARGFGDLSENFEYHAAKNEQGMLERKITILRDRLSRSVVVEDDDVPTGRIGVGSHVEIEDEAGERMNVEISSVGGVSPDSPLGRALYGAAAGDKVTIAAPGGSWVARVVSVGRSSHSARA
jgi:transcription elongation factor GreA